MNLKSSSVLLLLTLGCELNDDLGFDCKDGEGEVFIVTEQPPVFSGCQYSASKCSKDNLEIFLSSNLTYPTKASLYNVEGIVVVSFVVEKSGCITTKKIIQSIGFGCDEEALRLLQIMPPWSPGKINGIPVRVQYTLPIHFVL
jgi:protein TonB